jgi:hypothetical protein
MVAGTMLMLTRERAVLVGLATVVAASCRGVPEPALARLYEARRLVGEVRVQLAKAERASDRAVMAETDEASAAFAREARAAVEVTAGDAVRAETLLRELNHGPEAEQVATFRRQLAEYRKVDEQVLEMVVENTNAKAQRLAFGPVRAEADTFEAALRAVAASAPAKDRARAEALALEAALAVRQVQILEAPHIAEADDAAMDRFEVEIAAREGAARKAMTALAELAPAADRAPAQAAFDRFTKLSAEVVGLSRRNSNVRALAVSLRQKPALTSACDVTLASLDEALAKAIRGPTR